MTRNEILLQCLLAVAALTVFNRFFCHDTVLNSIIYSVGVVCSFWGGRMAVRLLKRRFSTQGLADD